MDDTKLSAFTEFVAVVERLRRECPWDREQTHRSIRESMIEEAYEVIEVVVMPLSEVRRRLEANEFDDGKTIIGLYALLAQTESL